MALTVNTNVTSLNVQKNLNKASDALSTSMTRLSSGLKINSAKDDAAGLQIATRMTSQIRGQTMAIKNGNDGISIAQTAEGAMQEQTNILQRMRELAVQSRNDSNSSDDRDALNKEFTAMASELSRIAGSTNLTGKNLLDGSGAPHLKVTDGVFYMNGRQVFNFALLKVPAHLHELLDESNLQADDIDAFCIHQGSAAIVDAVARRFEDGTSPEKFVKDMLETGNTVSSSIPLLLEKHVMNATWKRIAVSGFGVGLSWGSAILYRP